MQTPGEGLAGADPELRTAGMAEAGVVIVEHDRHVFQRGERGDVERLRARDV
jgi:hypothetical protein